jgi:restriction endonuclease S subunit
MLTQYKSFAAGSTVNNLNKELVGNTTVSFPKLSEQKIIGEYFNQIENLITLHHNNVVHRKSATVKKRNKFSDLSRADACLLGSNLFKHI